MLRMILTALLIILAIPLFSLVIRRMMGVRQRKWFSYDHINERHRKLEWRVRIGFVVIILLNTVIVFATGAVEDPPWYMEIWWLIFVFVVVLELLRAYMEYRFVDERKAMAATLSEAIFDAVLLGSAIATGFYGSI